MLGAAPRVGLPVFFAERISNGIDELIGFRQVSLEVLVILHGEALGIDLVSVVTRLGKSPTVHGRTVLEFWKS